MSTPRQKSGQLNKHSFVPQDTGIQHEGRTSPYDPNLSVENHLRNDTACQGDRAQNHSGDIPIRNQGTDHSSPPYQAPMGTQTTATSTNTANFNGQTSFQNPPRGLTSTNGSTGPSNNRYSQPPNKGLGKKASKHNLNYTQPSTSAIFTQPSSYPRAEI